jgi:hypothetical protein
VIVVVVVVRGVPVTVMDVVHVVAVRNGHMPTPDAVGVPGVLVCDVLGRLALVPVPLVAPVQVAVVDVVDVIGVRHADMPAAVAVNMLVLGVLKVCGGHRCVSYVGLGRTNT